jgi:hypothetical protein
VQATGVPTGKAEAAVTVIFAEAAIVAALPVPTWISFGPTSTSWASVLTVIEAVFAE